MHSSRPDFATSVIVNEGLSLKKSTNRYIAAHYMHHYGVTFRVIVRVLASDARVRTRTGVAAGKTPR